MPIPQEKIQQHTRLLNALNALDYVPTAQEDNAARLTIVWREISRKQQEVVELERKTKSEHKDLSRAKSTTRQFFLRIRQGGEAVTKQIERVNKEYVDALWAESDARNKLATLMNEKAQRETASIDLANKMTEIKRLKGEIEALYKGLFDGPTPEFPEEEQAENQLNIIESQYHRIQTLLNNHSTALALLIKAEKSVRTCMCKVSEARAVAAKSTGGDSFSQISEQLAQTASLFSGKIIASMAQSLLQQADQSSGCSVNQTVGSLSLVPDIPNLTEWNGESFVASVDLDFPRKLDESLRKFEEARGRLQGEIDRTYMRINEHRSTVERLASDLQNTRKELANIRCQIMLRLTSPAALDAQPHTSPRNAHEVGDPELPAYFDSANAAGRPATDPHGNISIGVPTYEESQAQNQPVGGFRAQLSGAGSQAIPAPVYPPPGFGPAPGPGGIGGFRGTAKNDSLTPPSLKLKIPEPQGSSLSFPSPRTPSRASQIAQPHIASWSPNPYASAMIRNASTDDEGPMLPGAWNIETNPFLRLTSEDPLTGAPHNDRTDPSAEPSVIRA